MQQPTTGPLSASRPRPAGEIRTVWRPPTDGPTAHTWQCTGCHTNVTNAAMVCDTCGIDRQGNDTYVYATDTRPEHAVALTWADGENAVDAIKAHTPELALEAARDNWPDATVTLVEDTEASRC